MSAFAIAPPTIIVRTATTATSTYTSTVPAGPAQYASWTQAAGSPFNTVTVKLALCAVDTGTATGTVYLTNAIGPSATVANQIASAPISTATACSDTTIQNPMTVFTGLTLPAATTTTYYLVIAETNGLLGVQASNIAVETLAPSGVTSNSDGYAPGSTASYPPATTFSPITSPAKGIILSVTGIAGLPPSATGVPTLGTFAMLGTVMLLAFSGLLFLKRESVNPLQ